MVIGRSNLVGRPLSNMLTLKGRDATVTLAHSRTRDLAAVCRAADVVVAAVGRQGLVTADMIRPGATVIDAPDVVDGNLVSCRGWPDMPQFGRAMMELFARHAASVPA